MSELNIAHLGDGSSVHIYRIVTALAKRGHVMSIITGSRYMPKAPIPNVSVHVYESDASIYSKVKQIREILRKISPDVLHSHFVNHGGVTGVLSGFHPHVVSAWGDDVLIVPKESLWQRGMIAATLRACDWTLPLSEPMREEIQRLSGRKSRNDVFYWGVDVKHFAPNERAASEFRKRIGVAESDLVVYSPRVLEPIYNHHLLIEAWPAVISKVPNAMLVIKRTMHDAAYEAKLRDKIKSLGIERSVIWIEHLNYDELAVSYAAADVVASVTPSDGTPITVLEAMACGTPIFATDLVTIRRWVVPGVTGVRTSFDPSDMSEKLIALLSGPAEERKRMGLAARSAILENAETEKCFENLEKIYHTVSAERAWSWVKSAQNMLRF